MYDVCCIGHITLDKIVTPDTEVFMPGGTSFYFANALHNIDKQFLLVTAVGKKELPIIEALRNKGIRIVLLPSKYTVYFENIYPENQDTRIQRVLQKADPFTIDAFKDINASIFHIGSLLADDIPIELIKFLSLKGKLSLDVQGFLREVRGTEVHAIDWTGKKEALQYISILKANESEMEVLTGTKDVAAGVRILAEWGVKEVIITLGSMGSVIYVNNTFHLVPAFEPSGKAVDATGCGDTYMAGYLYSRAKGISIDESGYFAAAMATLKIESSGPFQGTEADVKNKITTARKNHPQFTSK
jgi:sugar/nucleoside kinase (ribokinase family)